jgi:hypothetical protein
MRDAGLWLMRASKRCSVAPSHCRSRSSIRRPLETANDDALSVTDIEDSDSWKIGGRELAAPAAAIDLAQFSIVPTILSGRSGI